MLKPGGTAVLSDIHPFNVMIGGGVAGFPGAELTDGVPYVVNLTHQMGDYLRAFDEASLSIVDCLEPPWGDAQLSRLPGYPRLSGCVPAGLQRSPLSARLATDPRPVARSAALRSAASTASEPGLCELVCIDVDHDAELPSVRGLLQCEHPSCTCVAKVTSSIDARDQPAATAAVTGSQWKFTRSSASPGYATPSSRLPVSAA